MDHPLGDNWWCWDCAGVPNGDCRIRYRVVIVMMIYLMTVYKIVMVFGVAVHGKVIVAV